jgi:hypothetical protein
MPVYKFRCHRQPNGVVYESKRASSNRVPIDVSGAESQPLASLLWLDAQHPAKNTCSAHETSA